MSDDPQELNPFEYPPADAVDSKSLSDSQRRSPVSPRPQTSPVRPVNPQASGTNPTSPVRPTMPRPSTRNINIQQEENLSATDKAQLALDQLRQKIDNSVREYAEGRLNQAQFNAIYRRYSEQMEITQKLLERNPNSDAWESVIQPGHTGFLRAHYSAKILSYGLYRISNGQQIVLHGKLRLPQNQLLPIFHKLQLVLNEGRSVSPASRKLKDGSWVILIPGKYTASVVIFSGEPAAMQHKRMQDIHYDFERANIKLIQTGDFTVSQLVFPHRTLFG